MDRGRWVVMRVGAPSVEVGPGGGRGAGGGGLWGGRRSFATVTLFLHGHLSPEPLPPLSSFFLDVPKYAEYMPFSLKTNE